MEKKSFNKKNIFMDSLKQSFVKLSPRVQVKNPVMLVVYIGAILTTALYFLSFAGIKDENSSYILAISLILLFTVLFANFAEAIAEGRGRAQADTLRKARKDVKAKKLKSEDNVEEYTEVLSADLKKGDIVYVKTGEQIPMDGEVIDGAASVDESAITGESAPVIRESGGDRSAVTGGTTLVSDWLVIKVTAEAGESFLDKMISMVEGASRKKTPNEIALQILLVTLTIIFLVVTATLLPFSGFASTQAGTGSSISITNVIALLVCLATTTIGALLSSIGIAGMSRLNQANVLAMSGRAIEAVEAGVDDFLAEAMPETKLTLIRDYQTKVHLVAMTGDGTNDAPALAQADVAVAMNTGTQAAKEAGNMVDLDSSPTKLIDIVRIGKQLLMTRGSLTTFSVANDVAKYFAIIPVLFFGIYPLLTDLNFMGLTSSTSAILSAIIYNALIIIALIPLALRGVKYREVPAGELLKRNMLIYGLGGIAAPFIAIKLIDMLLTVCSIV